MKVRYLTSLNLENIVDAARAVPYQRVNSDQFPGVEVWIRRDDLLDPLISGNKAYKLLYNLVEARQRGINTLITCGGAWSNHLHATAAAGARFGFRTVGIIRGERPPVMSEMLKDAERLGMEFNFVSRQEYRWRHLPDFLSLTGFKASSSLYIPEGGANLAGARGVALLGEVIEETAPVEFDQLWLACGTGLTFAGLSSSVKSFSVCGVEVLRAGGAIGRNAWYWLAALSENKIGWKEEFAENELDLTDQYHCGGYSKYPGQLQDFQRAFESQSRIPLDPVYTAKLMYALSQEANAGRFRDNAKLLALHSGGLQGRRGFQ
ncbi:1-aminocyclopropane-1-carboxylate deaminase/D-cysteine desulfhydrase [Microbulbifer sp. TRSA002]|uniref:1-aminocyclopropane-1-carboxylate deaminase/D-cysteine desulfhydrase n=1 Tax=Microbulbifer sp. TRSA002 TaxID=3243382 RepID=UPI004039F691